MLLIPDLGADRIHRRRDAGGHCLSPLAVPDGSGPRHLAITPGGRLYVVNELANTVDVIEQGRVVQTAPTLPAGTKASSTAEIALTPAGDLLVVSNRGHDSLACFPVDAASGRLGAPRFCPTGGRHPRHFAIDPDGRWALVANRDSDNLVAVSLAPDTFGAQADVLEVPAPVCIAW